MAWRGVVAAWWGWEGVLKRPVPVCMVVLVCVYVLFGFFLMEIRNTLDS